MIHFIRPMLAGATLAAALAAAPLAAQAGGTLVTVTGTVETTNRGAFDEGRDKLFAFNDVRFEKAHAFDLDALKALPQERVETDFPLGGPTVVFEGPALDEVLKAAGASGETVTVRAMDGYAVEMPLGEAIGKGAVLALARDGESFGIGDFGPVQIVFPRGDREELAGMPDDWWVWQIYHIVVE